MLWIGSRNSFSSRCGDTVVCTGVVVSGVCTCCLSSCSKDANVLSK
jgi:hypothetical protein